MIKEMIIKIFNILKENIKDNKIMFNAYRTQGFGENKEYYSKYDLDGHEGIDYSTKGDRTIYNVEYCQVIEDVDLPRGNYGNHVTIYYEKSNLVVTYAHMVENYVSNGQNIKPGEKIGIMGNTGNSKGAHLHIMGFRPKYGNPWKRENYDNGYKGMIDIEKEWIIPKKYM